MNSPCVGSFCHHQRGTPCQRGIRSFGAASQTCFSLVEAADSSTIQLCVLNWVTSSKLLPPPHLVWAPSHLSVTDNNLAGPSRNAHFSHHLHYPPPPPTPPPAPLFLPPGNSHWDAGCLEKKNSERITLSFIHKRSRGIPANFLLYCDGSGVEEPKDFKEF